MTNLTPEEETAALEGFLLSEALRLINQASFSPKTRQWEQDALAWKRGFEQVKERWRDEQL